MERFLNDEGERLKGLAKRLLDEKIEHIYWVGSGHSGCSLAPGKYKIYTDFPAMCMSY